jgi:HAE1 family hydrophobic/amphiphilic exporter-1
MSIYSTAVEKPISTIMIFVGVIVFGLYSLVQLPIDFYPEMDAPFMSVMTTYPGANAADIEENITKTLEDALNSVENLKKLTSTSMDNMSLVTIQFEWGSNLDEASNNIRDAIDRTLNYLPEGVQRPAIFKFNTSMMPILLYTITAKESYAALDKIIEEKIINQINRIDGVGSAAMNGTPKRVVYVDIDPARLQAYNLTLERVSALIAAENMNMPSGNMKMGMMDYQVRIEGEFPQSEVINDLMIGTLNGKSIYMKDIATVRDTIKDQTMFQVVNGQDGAVMFVMKQSSANSVQVCKKVRQEIEALKNTLPSDIQIDTLYDSSDFITQSINNLSEALLYALIFVVLVVLVFLGRWRATIIIALTIPISLISAFIYLLVTGQSLNIISISSLSIAIGMVVDDAIVVLENITNHIERGSNPREAAKYATNEVWLAVIATTLVVVAVFLPLTLTGGITGILFSQLGWIVTITITVSTITAISLTPMLSSRMLKLKEKQKVSTRKFTYDNTILKALDKLDEVYTQTIRWVLRHKTTTLLIGIGMLVVSFMLMRKIGTDFMPQTDQGSINVMIKCQTGQRVEETEKTAIQVEKIIRDSYPEMIAINHSYGYSDESNMFALFSKTGSNYINFRTRLVNADQRDRSVFVIASDLRKKLDTIPAIINYNVTTGGGGMFGGDNTVDVEIFGHSFQETNKLAQDISSKMRTVKGTADIQISREDDKPEIQITLDQKKLSQHGLTTAMASAFIRSQMYGITASKYKEDGEEYDIIVRFREADRNTITQIENFNVATPTGKTIKLKELGQIEEIWTPPSIQREQRQRIVKVSIKPDGISLGELANIIKEEMKEIPIPQGISINIGGSYQDQQESMSDLGLLMALIIVLVYIVMATQFESFKMPLIIMSSFLFAIPGIVLALLITNTTLSIVAALGAVLLIGIVVKNGIVLVDFINLMRERGYRLYEAIALACKSRLRPVLMTAITTILGMTPMAFSSGSGSETWKPMGIVVIGGLIFSTVVTMIIVPVLYAAMTRSGGRDRVKTIRKQMHFMDDYKA